MGKLTLKQAAAWCGGWVDPKYENVEFFGANNDSRLIQPGQLFVALTGARDGYDFIPDAKKRGAAAALCSRNIDDFPAIVVDDPRRALGDIARQERRRIGCKVIGITGSVGKSTTKEMTAAVLQKSYRTSKTPANYNNDIGLPMTILAMPEDAEVAVLEMGMNHFREMAYLSSIAAPNIAVIVNIGTMHIENLGSMEGIRKAKLEILEGMDGTGRLILYGDDKMLRKLPEEPKQEITYFGTREDCAVRAENVRTEGEHLCFTVHAASECFPVVLSLEGEHYLPDALAAVTAALMLGVPTEQIAQGLADFHNLAGRQEIFHLEDFTVISDCYNAGPESMAAALGVLGKKSGRRIAVLGDMLELGECAPEAHFHVGQLAARNAELLFTYGSNAKRVVCGAVSAGMPAACARSFGTHDELMRELADAAKPGDTLLFKGSHGMHMERLVERFVKTERKRTEE